MRNALNLDQQPIGYQKVRAPILETSILQPSAYAFAHAHVVGSKAILSLVFDAAVVQQKCQCFFRFAHARYTGCCILFVMPLVSVEYGAPVHRICCVDYERSRYEWV